ncbi:MAG: hypothetical protein ED859_16260 [Desulfuromonadales bacterium]|nr:MAG: hypothetical protein ED859_16260 [Desulfuromonadales bacterium]
MAALRDGGFYAIKGAMIRSRSPETLFSVILLFAVAAAFGVSVANGFVWDDTTFFIGNPVYRDFDLRAMLLGLANGVEYLPVRDLSIALDYRFWGENPAGFHVTNLILYGANVLAVFWMTRLMVALPAFGGDPANSRRPDSVAFWTALFFAVHPLHAEAVNFVTCRNVLLSGLFGFLSVGFFLHGIRVERSGWRWFAVSSGSFLLALFSKATVIALPLFLAALLVITGGAEVRRRWWPALVPFFVLAGGGFLLFRAIGAATNIISPDAAEPLASRLATAFQIPFFYLAKFLVPTALSAEYAFTFPEGFGQPQVLAAIAGWLLVSALVVVARKRYPLVPLAAVWFLATLLPVLHIFPTYPVVADRYAYLPVYGPCLLLALPVERFAAGGLARPAMAAAAVVVLWWGVLGFQRSSVWLSDTTLWQNVAENYPRHVKAHESLGAAYFQAGDYNRAFQAFSRARQIDSSNPFLDFFYGFLYFDTGNYAAALDLFRSATGRDPGFIMGLYYLGQSFERVGDAAKAAEAYRQLLGSTELDPQGFYKGSARRRLAALGAGSREKDSKPIP